MDGRDGGLDDGLDGDLDTRGVSLGGAGLRVYIEGADTAELRESGRPYDGRIGGERGRAGDIGNCGTNLGESRPVEGTLLDGVTARGGCSIEMRGCPMLLRINRGWCSNQRNDLLTTNIIVSANRHVD